MRPARPPPVLSKWYNGRVKGKPLLFLISVVFSTAVFICCALGSRWEERLCTQAPDGQLVRGQMSGGGGGTSGTTQRLRRVGSMLTAEYGFKNFNRDRLRINYRLSVKAFKAYSARYGYSSADIKKIDAWRNEMYQSAWAGQTDGIDRQYLQKLKAYLASRGFRLLPGNVVEADIPWIVRRNIRELKPLALAFQQIADRLGYDSEDTVGAVVSMAQTAMKYKEPPLVEYGKRTGGILPPVKALLRGWGDCDTKSALLAAIIANWDMARMVGIAVPGHYLMGIRRIPAKGDMFVEYGGLKYILIEPAGPGWFPPGTVAQDTLAQMREGEGYRIEPFF